MSFLGSENVADGGNSAIKYGDCTKKKIFVTLDVEERNTKKVLSQTRKRARSTLCLPFS